MEFEMKYVRGSGTSHEAAKRLRGAETKRQQVLAVIQSFGRDGVIDDELQKALGWQLNTLHPRRIELYESGAILKYRGKTRQTRFARAAEIYIAREFAQPGDDLLEYGGHETCGQCGHSEAQHVVWSPSPSGEG
jgi:hypothetical protein